MKANKKIERNENEEIMRNETLYPAPGVTKIDVKCGACPSK